MNGKVIEACESSSKDVMIALVSFFATQQVHVMAQHYEFFGMSSRVFGMHSKHMHCTRTVQYKYQA
jgi:hypothetical protein